MLFNEPKLLKLDVEELALGLANGFSALQRAEIAEIPRRARVGGVEHRVSVLFNEPKLLKCCVTASRVSSGSGFSALQRAEIAEIQVCTPTL